MRPFTSLVAGLVAVLAAIVTIPLLWVSAHVADEDGYVAFSSRLATDDELQAAFAAYLADDLVRRGVLPESLQDTASAALTVVARQTTNEPGFVEAWEDTQRRFHSSAFDDEAGPLQVDVGPMADFVAARVGDRLPVSLEVPEGLTIAVGTEAERAQLGRISQATTFGLLGLLVVIVAGVTSILAAHSRPLAIAGLGIGALAAAGLLRLATSELSPRVLDEIRGQSAFARSFQQLLVDRAADSLAGWLTWVAVGGAAALAIGLVGRVVAGRPQAG